LVQSLTLILYFHELKVLSIHSSPIRELKWRIV